MPISAADDPSRRAQGRARRVADHSASQGATRGEFATFAKGRGASDLMVPSEIVTIAAIPLLGSGKIDFPAVKRLVEEREARKAAA